MSAEDFVEKTRDSGSECCATRDRMALLMGASFGRRVGIPAAAAGEQLT